MAGPPFGGQEACFGLGPVVGECSVLRGGAWSSYSACCRSAHRTSASPSNRNNSVGLRALCELICCIELLVVAWSVLNLTQLQPCQITEPTEAIGTWPHCPADPTAALRRCLVQSGRPTEYGHQWASGRRRRFRQSARPRRSANALNR